MTIIWKPKTKFSNFTWRISVISFYSNSNQQINQKKKQIEGANLQISIKYLVHQTSFGTGGSNLFFGRPTWRRRPVIPRWRTLLRPRFHRKTQLFRRWLRLIRAVRHPGAIHSRFPLAAGRSNRTVSRGMNILYVDAFHFFY